MKDIGLLIRYSLMKKEKYLIEKEKIKINKKKHSICVSTIYIDIATVNY